MLKVFSYSLPLSKTSKYLYFSDIFIATHSREYSLDTLGAWLAFLMTIPQNVGTHRKNHLSLHCTKNSSMKLDTRTRSC